MAIVILPAEREQLTLEILYVRFMKCSSRKVFRNNYIVSVYLDWGCNSQAKPLQKHTSIKVKHVAGHPPGIMKRSIFWRKSNNTNLQKMVVLQDFPIKSALFGLVSSYKWPPCKVCQGSWKQICRAPRLPRSPRKQLTPLSWISGLSRGEGAAGAWDDMSFHPKNPS